MRRLLLEPRLVTRGARSLRLVGWSLYPGCVSDEDFKEERRRKLWEQYAKAHARIEETFDSAVRAAAAGGLAITVSLATALKEMSFSGGLAATLFLSALAVNLASYWTARKDMDLRLDALIHRRENEYERTKLTRLTQRLNVGAGACVVLGGTCLAWFVISATGSDGG